MNTAFWSHWIKQTNLINRNGTRFYLTLKKASHYHNRVLSVSSTWQLLVLGGGGGRWRQLSPILWIWRTAVPILNIVIVECWSSDNGERHTPKETQCICNGLIQPAINRLSDPTSHQPLQNTADGCLTLHSSASHSPFGIELACLGHSLQCKQGSLAYKRGHEANGLAFVLPYSFRVVKLKLGHSFFLFLLTCSLNILLGLC